MVSDSKTKIIHAIFRLIINTVFSWHECSNSYLFWYSNIEILILSTYTIMQYISNLSMPLLFLLTYVFAQMIAEYLV